MILFLTDSDQDYGADYLYDGFCSMLGPSEVIDWPPKPSLHGGEQMVFDCDLWWPEHGRPVHALDFIMSTTFDLIVVPSLRRGVVKGAGVLRTLGVLAKHAGKVVAYDGEDRTPWTQPHFEQLVGQPVHYFKREVPIEAEVPDWQVLPFSYPARRIQPINGRPSQVFASWQVWGWAKGGVREQLAQALMQMPVRRFVECYTDAQYSTGERLSPRAYHAHARSSTVGVAPAGAGYFTNRLFELIADGCSVVAERPTVRFPLGFRDGLEIHYFDDVRHACRQVQWLYDNPDIARRTAACAQRHLLDHHTTKHRAEQVWRRVYGAGAD